MPESANPAWRSAWAAMSVGMPIKEAQATYGMTDRDLTNMLREMFGGSESRHFLKIPLAELVDIDESDEGDIVLVSVHEELPIALPDLMDALVSHVSAALPAFEVIQDDDNLIAVPNALLTDVPRSLLPALVKQITDALLDHGWRSTRSGFEPPSGG